MKNQPIILGRRFNVPASKVWNAIANRDEMSKWYFDLNEFKAEVGFQFQFSGGPIPERQYLHLCEITEVIQGQKLKHSWSYDGYTGVSFLTFELIEHLNQTMLRLIHEGIETFPPGNLDLAKENFEEGWNHIINVSLRDYLESNF